MPRQLSPAHDWCFTINNPRADRPGRQGDLTRVKSWQYNYLVLQLEVGAEGTPHYQGFVQFTTKQRLTALKKLHKRAHWEPRRGSAYQAAHYCKKPEIGCDCHHCVEAAGIARPQFIYESGSISAPAGEKLMSVAMSLKRHGLSKTIIQYPTHYMGIQRGMVIGHKLIAGSSGYILFPSSRLADCRFSPLRSARDWKNSLRHAGPFALQTFGFWREGPDGLLWGLSSR